MVEGNFEKKKTDVAVEGGADWSILEDTTEKSRSSEGIRAAWQKIGSKIIDAFRRKKRQTATEVVDEKIESDVGDDAEGNTGSTAEPETTETPRGHDPVTDDDVALIAGMDKYRQDKKEWRRGERAQELFERGLNQVLTSIDELEAAAEAGEEGIAKRTETYGDKEITIYDLSGYSMRFLQHAIGYKMTDDPNWQERTSGYNTAQRLLNDPAFWMRHRNEAMVEKQKNVVDQEADTLSLSYVDIDANPRYGGAATHGKPVYGFLSVPADSVIGTYRGDGSTPYADGDRRVRPDDINVTATDFAATSDRSYNEVALRRYGEDGRPTVVPDCMIVHNGQITEDTKKHAAYFGIPIINVVDEAYEVKKTKQLVAEVNSLNEDDPYEKIFQVFSDIQYSKMSHVKLWKEDVFGKEATKMPEIGSEVLGAAMSESERAKLVDFIDRIEPAKRLEMLDRELERVIAEAEDAKARNEYYMNKTFWLNKGIRRRAEADGTVREEEEIDIDYSYPISGGGVKQIKTSIYETDAAYEHFSELFDRYKESKS